jgi:hypothetical protein
VNSRRLDTTHLLLQLEGVLVEVLLQHLVRVVDAQLLERVLLEDLEPASASTAAQFISSSIQLHNNSSTNPIRCSPEDVEDTNRLAALGCLTHGLVDLLNQPVEHLRVDVFAQSVAVIASLLRLVRQTAD